MESGNACCSVCTANDTQWYCICKFPLFPLCSSAECKNFHAGKESKCFHYSLPITACHSITARNHRSYQQWIISLHYTQLKLTNSLSLLDTAIMQIEKSYKQQVAALTALKDQYIERVNQLKQAATQAFQSAVAETAYNAVNGEYIRQSDIAEWIWTTASKTEDDDIPLFSCEMREKGIEEIGEMFAVKVTSTFQSLAPWGMDFPAETLKMNREELDKLTMKIAMLEQKDKDSENVIRSLRAEMENNQKKTEQLMAKVLERKDMSDKSVNTEVESHNTHLPQSESVPVRPSLSISRYRTSTISSAVLLQEPDVLGQQEGTKARYTKHRTKSSLIDMSMQVLDSRDIWAEEGHTLPSCKSCNAVFLPVDADFQCHNACMCKVCSIESVLARGKQSCVHCSEPFSANVISVMLKEAKKCHVCGIALPLNAFAKNAKCDVCLRCIRISGTIAKCAKCRCYNFHIVVEDIERIRTERDYYACCRFAEGERFHSVLRCGHPVCKVHKRTLLVCRICRNEVRIL